MSLIRTIARTNLLPLWRRRVRVWRFEFTAPSLDRFTALLLHKVKIMGNADKVFFESTLKAGMNVVDIGANQGLYSLLFSRLVGEAGTVITFEPEPDMFAALQRNVLANSIRNIECHELALSSRPGEAMLSRSLIHSGDNRLSDGHSNGTSIKKSVRLATLDEIVGERRIDFVKIDVQGWEGEVLRGMTTTLRRNRDIGVHFEFWPRGLRQAGVEPLDLLRFLSEEGLRIYRCDKNTRTPVQDFSSLLNEIHGTTFINLYARRDV